MKINLTAVFLSTIFLNVYATGLSQSITFSGENVPLTKVFQVIKKQTGYFVFANKEVLTHVRPVTLSAKDMPLNNFLQLALKDQPVGYLIEGKTIILSGKPATINIEPRPAPLPADTVPKMTTVYGKVVDEKGIGITGASVVLKGAGRGVTTNQAGNFVFALLPIGGKLQISYVGFETQEIEVRPGNVTITMKSAEAKLNDVVVTGIYTRKSESFTGAAQTYTREDLQKVGNVNVLQSLKNLDPTFNLVENLAMGSNPNTLPEIQLRGQSGFPDLKGEYQTNPNQPLFILDGFEVSIIRVIDLDMTRVLSVTLLKDAAAKAIYGSKAANGVVVIETQKPKAGRIQLTYTGNLNMVTPDLSSYNLTNATEKLAVEKNAGLYDMRTRNSIFDAGEQYRYDQEYNRILEEVLRGVNTDWKAKPVRTALGQKHSLYAEGGSDQLRYGIDFQYNNVPGGMKGSSRNTISGAITLSYRTQKWLFRNVIDVVFNKGTESPWGNYSDYTRMNPYFRPTDTFGNTTKIAGENLIIGSLVGNPMWNATINTKNFERYSQINNNFYAEYQATQELKLTGRIGYSNQESNAETFYPASHTAFLAYTTPDLIRRKGQYIYTNGRRTNVSGDLFAGYSKTLAGHFFYLTLGANMTQQINRSTTFQAEGFPNDYMEDIIFARQYLLNGRPSGFENTTRDLGVFSNLNYSYDDRYLLDASFRMNGSSQFGKQNRWGQFWAVGLGWNLHKEAFLRNAKYIDQLKIRGSVGYTGSQNFNSYQSKATFNYNPNDDYLGNFGAFLLGLENERLQWQRKFDQNLGLDLTMLNRRLNFRFDYYISNTDDLLTDVSVPLSTGFTSYKENLGEVQNTGVEFRLSYALWKDKRNNFFSFYVGGTHNANKVRKISNSLESFNKTQTETITNRPVVRYTEGQSLSAIWAVPSYGIDPATGREIFIRKDGSIIYRWIADDLAVVGNAEPKVRGNAGFNFDYSGFSLNVGIIYKFGGQIYNQTLVDKVENADLRYNVDRRIFTGRWTKPGDVSRYKSIMQGDITRATQRFVEDQNEWELSSVSMYYDLNRIMSVQRTGIKRLRLGFNMNDVARVSTVQIERGTSYPFVRTFSFSIQAMF
ncbi:MAG: SusC/RagA family TonB-linked outer membrane protein [Niastella sp.]|nr:SusC/RagA family TonB-linked outer membrane protein [Niastella sp.]